MAAGTVVNEDEGCHICVQSKDQDCDQNFPFRYGARATLLTPPCFAVTYLYAPAPSVATAAAVSPATVAVLHQVGGCVYIPS